jgi:hypothetical protein
VKVLRQRLSAGILLVAEGCGVIEGPATAPAPEVGKVDAGTAMLDAGANGWVRRSASTDRIDVGDLAMMLDVDGHPHVAYSTMDRDLFLRDVWWSGDRFETEEIDHYGRGRRKAWVAGSPVPRIVYDSLTPNIASFSAVREQAAQWTVEIVDYDDQSAAVTGRWLDDRVVLARLSASSTSEVGAGNVPLTRFGVVYDGHSIPAEWTQLSPDAVPGLLAFATDSLGAAHIVYSAPVDDYKKYPPSSDLLPPQTLRYVRFSAGEWTDFQTLSERPGYYDGLAIAVGVQDKVQVVYSELSTIPEPEGYPDPPKFEVKYLTRTGSSPWTRESVPGLKPVRVARGGMALDASGNVNLAYCLIGDKPPLCSGVGYAHQTSNGWESETIEADCERVGEEAALAIGTDTIHIAYRGCDGSVTVASKRITPDPQ